MTIESDLARCLAQTKHLHTNIVGSMQRHDVDAIVAQGVSPHGVPFTAIVVQGEFSEAMADLGRKVAAQLLTEKRKAPSDG